VADAGEVAWFVGLASIVLGVPGWLVATGAWAVVTAARRPTSDQLGLDLGT
jgi:hypothetical protein